MSLKSKRLHILSAHLFVTTVLRPLPLAARMMKNIALCQTVIFCRPVPTIRRRIFSCTSLASAWAVHLTPANTQAWAVRVTTIDTSKTRLGMCHYTLTPTTTLRLGLCHNTLTPATTPRFGLCHNTLTPATTPRLGCVTTH